MTRRASNPIGLAVAGMLTATLCAGSAAPTYKIIVHPDNLQTAITAKDLSALFLKRKTEWADGTSVAPVDQLATAPLREQFSKDVHGRRTSDVKRYWLQIVFSGRGVPPVEKGSDADVIAFVKNRKGAIGYVAAATQTSDVKVLRVSP